MKKKILSALITTSMLLSSGSFTAWANDNTVEKIYADIYGLDVTFASVPLETDYADLSITDSDGNAIGYSQSLENNILHVDFNNPIEPNSSFLLNVDGNKKAVKVKKEFFDDFESLAVSNKVGQVTTDSITVKGFVTNNADLTGTEGKKLGVSGSPLSFINYTAFPADLTFSADIMGYHKPFIRGDGTLNARNAVVHLGLRSKNTNYIDCYGLDMGGNNVSVGVHNYSDNKSYGMAQGRSKSYTPAAGIVSGELYIPSTDIEKMQAEGKTPDNTGYDNLDLQVTKQAEEHKYVLRNYNNVIGGYMDGHYIGTVIDEENRFPSGKAILQATDPSVFLIDNLLVTSCEIKDIIAVRAVGAYADTFHAEIKTDAELFGDSFVNVDKLSLREQKTGAAVAITKGDISVSGNSFRINVPLKTGVNYVLTAGAGFGSNIETLENDYSVMFCINKLWGENFDTAPEQLLGALFRGADTSDSGSRATLKVMDGKLWVTGSALAPIVNELKTEPNATFSFDMNMYSALNRKEFQENYNRTAPYMHVGFNAEALTIGGTNDLRFTWDNYATRRFGWYILNGQFRRGHNAGNYTVIAPAEGSNYKAGDIVYSGNLYNNFFTPTTQTGKIEKIGDEIIGEVDYGEHFKNANTIKIPFGDAYYDSQTKTYSVYHKGEALPEAYTSNSKTGVTVSQRETENFPVRIEKQGNIGSLVYSGDVVDTYNTQDEKTTGYFALNSQGTEILALDNMLITSYNEITSINDIKLVTADTYGIVLKSPEKINSILTFDGLSIVNANTGDAVAPTGASSTGKSLFINAPLEKDVPYKLTIQSGFAGTDVVYAGDTYTEYFMVKEVKHVDGSNAESLNSIGLQEYHSDKGYRAIKDDHMEMFSTSFNTGKYENASISYKIAYYSDADNAAPYSNNIIKGNGNKFTSEILDRNNKKVEMQTGAIDMYLAGAGLSGANISIATADEKPVVYHNYTETRFLNGVKFPKGVYAKGTDESGNVAITYPKGTVPHVERYVMAGDAYRMYSDDVLAYEIEQPGLNKEGYVQIGGSARAVVWLYEATVTQMEIIKEVDLKVSNLTADADSIYVTFDNNIEGTKDFQKVSVTKNGEAVEADFGVTKNTLTIMPKAGMISDEVYTLSIDSGFGPSELSLTKEVYNKRFSVTIYVNEKFNNGKLSDNSAVKFNGNTPTFADGGAVFQGVMGLDDAAMNNAKDYTVKFDYKLYTASMNNDDKNYYDSVPYTNMWFNADKLSLPNTGYYWYMNYDGVRPFARVNGIGTELTKGLYSERKTEFGDAYCEKDGSITLFAEGDVLTDKQGEFIAFADIDRTEVVAESERTPKLYEYRIDKAGKGASLYRDGVLISSITGNESDGITADRGYFGMHAQITEFIWIDNVQAYTFNEANDIYTSLDIANNKVVIDNMGEEKNAVIIVAAYNANNAMVDTYVSDRNTVPNGISEVPYVLENAEGAVTYRAFVWDSLTNLKPYSFCKIEK